MRTELRKWEAGSRHLSYPHYIGGDAMLPLGDTSSLQLSSQVSRMWEKWLFWEIQSICTCILYTYIYTDSDSLIHWMVLPFWCSQHALMFQDKDTHSESCHRDPYYAAFNLQKKNLQIVCQKTSIFFVPGAFPFPNCSSTILQYSSPVSGKSPLGSCMICIRFFHP